MLVWFVVVVILLMFVFFVGDVSVASILSGYRNFVRDDSRERDVLLLLLSFIVVHVNALKCCLFP
jgi:hypothetical protein